MRIALDAMGSDRAPAIEVEGAIDALRVLGPDLRLVLVGDSERIEVELGRHPAADRERIEIVHAPDRIEMSDPPTQAIRRKPNSSMVVGLNLQKQGEVDAFISAGSTGAALAGSLMLLRPLAGVDRPAIGAVLPTRSGDILMIDAGANVDVRPQHLLQFAHLGTIYAQDLLGVENPRVGLLNIGEEPEKGNELAVEGHKLLRESTLHFVGNIEGRDIIEDVCDVVVCDGFVGNVLLKFYESVAGFIVALLRKELETSGADIDLSHVFRMLDYTERGGAPLLGVDGIVVICHGGSPPRAIQNAIRVAMQAVERDMVTHIRNRLARLVDSQNRT